MLGSGPNRIGQGLEFDYCCVHAAEAITDAGYESVMINCNPETVSTDYDTSDRLYFEPLTFEDVLAVVEREKPIGVLVQFGGQTPLKLAKPLEKAGVPILGTSPEAIDRAEDRERFGELLADVNLQAPPWGVARDVAEGLKSGAASDTRFSSGRATCSAAARCASHTTRRRSNRSSRKRSPPFRTGPC